MPLDYMAIQDRCTPKSLNQKMNTTFGIIISLQWGHQSIIHGVEETHGGQVHMVRSCYDVMNAISDQFSPNIGNGDGLGGTVRYCVVGTRHHQYRERRPQGHVWMDYLASSNTEPHFIIYQIRHFVVRSREDSKPWDWCFELLHRCEIWQAHRQQCCRCACQISERSDSSRYKSRGFETSQDLTRRRFIGYWNRALVF